MAPRVYCSVYGCFNSSIVKPGLTFFRLPADSERCLCQEDVKGACSYKRRNSRKYEKPKWVDEHNFGKQYKPSFNVAPTDVTPVLVSAENFGLGDADERIVKPMMWGMVPPWHKGDYKSHGLTTNNCRLETINTSKLYGTALRDGYRCVILAEGFYEWQTTKDKKNKQPYYIYCPQEEGVKIEDETTWNNKLDVETGWRGIRLLQMAGLYNVWSGQEGPLYSYSVITMESNSTLDWLHHRMPAILESDEEVAAWLNPTSVPSGKAVSMLKTAQSLVWHPVSTAVNSSRNKVPECNKPVVPGAVMPKAENPKLAASKNFMSTWLSGGKRKSEGSDETAKKQK